MAKKTAKKKKPVKTPPKKKPARRPYKAVQSVLAMPPEPESMTVVEIETEKKLSAKIIVGKRIGKITQPTDLFTVIGIATGTKVGQSTYGEWVGLRGQFEVVRCDDGKTLTAPLLILPEIMDRIMEPGDSVEFAALVSVDPSTNLAGFEYRVSWILQPCSHDPLRKLREVKNTWLLGGGKF